jgi:hypothetical protein
LLEPEEVADSHLSNDHVSLADVFGFAWRPRARKATTRLEDVTTFPIWQALNELSVTLPSPPALDDSLSAWEGLKVLELCYEQAIVHLGDPKYKASAAQHVVHAMVGKNAEVARCARDFVLACQELARDGSPISPLVWTWWRVTSLHKRGMSPYAAKVVWSQRIREKKLRRFFYEETSYSALSGRPLWPRAAGQLLGLWRRLEHEVVSMSSEEAAKLWLSWEPSARRLVEVGGAQRDAIKARIAKHVAKWDLGMWLTSNLLDYLKLPKQASALVPIAPKRRTSR